MYEADLSALSVDQLVVLAQEGNDPAYGELHERLNARLLRGLSLSVPRELAEDAAQEAWIRAYERLGDLDKPESFFSWLATIARNSAKSVLRASDRRTTYLVGSETSSDPNADPYEAAELREREEAARSALDSLPERQQKALRLRWIDGWSYRAIANLTGHSVSAIETLLYRARSNFHRHYESALSGLEAADGVACYKMRAQIRRLSDGALSERRRARVLSHLDHCARCRDVHDRMGEVWPSRGFLPLPVFPVPALLRQAVASIASRLSPAGHQLGSFVGASGTVGAAIAVGAGGLIAGLAVYGEVATEGQEVVADRDTPALEREVAASSDRTSQLADGSTFATDAVASEASGASIGRVPADVITAPQSDRDISAVPVDEAALDVDTGSSEGMLNQTLDEVLTEVVQPVQQVAATLLDVPLITSTVTAVDDVLGVVAEPVGALLPDLP